MLDEKSLESSELYSHRFNDFSIMVIIPSIIVVILTFAFMIFGKKELTVKSVGEINPNMKLSVLQSTSSGKVIKNELKEGKYVRKNQILVTYSNSENVYKLKQIKHEISQDEGNEESLKILGKGVKSNNNVFENKSDKYGNANVLANYLAQRKVYVLEKENGLDSDEQKRSLRLKLLVQLILKNPN